MLNGWQGDTPVFHLYTPQVQFDVLTFEKRILSMLICIIFFIVSWITNGRKVGNVSAAKQKSEYSFNGTSRVLNTFLLINLLINLYMSGNNQPYERC